MPSSFCVHFTKIVVHVLHTYIYPTGLSLPQYRKLVTQFLDCNEVDAFAIIEDTSSSFRDRESSTVPNCKTSLLVILMDVLSSEE